MVNNLKCKCFYCEHEGDVNQMDLYKNITLPLAQGLSQNEEIDIVVFDFTCEKCSEVSTIQLSLFCVDEEPHQIIEVEPYRLIGSLFVIKGDLKDLKDEKYLYIQYNEKDYKAKRLFKSLYWLEIIPESEIEKIMC